MSTSSIDLVDCRVGFGALMLVVQAGIWQLPASMEERTTS